MSAVNPSIYTKITISNAGGTTSATDYDLIPVDGRTMGIEAITDEVDNNQLLKHGETLDVEFFCYDMAILSDARVQNTSAIPANLARVVFVNEAGSGNVTIDAIRLVGAQNFEGDRPRAHVKGKFAVTGAATTIS